MAATTYFITGVNRGIGLQMVKLLASEPSNVIVGSVRDSSKITGELKVLIENNPNIKLVNLELTSEESLNGIGAQLETVAPEGIDIFVANAAYSGTVTPLLECTMDVFTAHVVANAFGPLKVMNSIKNNMMKKESRQAFFITSSLGYINEFHPHLATAYSVSKATLNSVLKCINVDLAPFGFTLVAVDPGICDTHLFNDFFDKAELGKNEEFAQYVAKVKKSPAVAAESIFKNVVGKVTKKDTGKVFDHNGVEHFF